MPDPALIGAGITAGAGLISTGVNAVTQINQNKRERRHAIYMYDRQRADALADWAMQNEYNSPREIMKRYREAGLNPNLIYGNGTNAQADNVRSSSPGNWSPRAPQIDLATPVSQGILAYNDLRMKDAQIDLLTTQNTVAEQEKIMKAAQTLDILSTTKTREFDLEMKDRLKEISVQAAEASLANTKAQTTSTLDANDRAAMMNAYNIQQAIENILTARMNRSKTVEEKKLIRAQIESVRKDTRLKELDISLKEKGIQPSDNLAMRIIARAIDNLPAMKVKANPLYKYDQRQPWNFFSPPSFKKP